MDLILIGIFYVLAAPYFFIRFLYRRFMFRLQLIDNLGAPISRESIKTGFLKTLTPLRMENISIEKLSMCDLRMHKIRVSTRGARIRLKHIYHNGIKPLCLLYEEGIVLRYGLYYYYFPFSEVGNKIKARLLFKECDDLTYELKRSENKIDVLQNILDNDYYYHYDKTLTGESRGKNLDTRHYTKSGALDKRYSKQNLQTGGSYINRTYSEEEKFLAHNGYILYINNVVELMIEATKEDFLSLITKLFSKSECQNLEIDENYGKMSWGDNFKYVRLLTEEDRKKIKSLISSTSVYNDESNDRIKDIGDIQNEIKLGKYKKYVDGVERPMSVKEVLEFKEEMKKFSKSTSLNQYEQIFKSIVNARRQELANMK